MEYAVDDILEKFDFEKVHAYMVLTGWEWGTPMHIPSVSELKHTARRLVTELMESPNSRFVSCGGFTVEYHDYDEEPEITLSFEIEDSSTYWSRP